MTSENAAVAAATDPDSQSDRVMQIFKAQQTYMASTNRIIAAKEHWQREAHRWQMAFLIVCVQFLVVAVAAVWGWAR